MKVLLDHNVPRRLRHALENHAVNTAAEMGWAKIANGKLLQAAEQAGFEMIITADQNLSYQQNLQGRKLALVVLSTNNWSALQRHIPAVLRAVDAALPGSFSVVAT